MRWRIGFQTLRTRLMLTYIGLIVLGFGGLTLFAGQQVANSAVEDFADILKEKVLLVAHDLADLQEPYQKGNISATQLKNSIARFAGQTESRITLIDIQGNAFFDSAGQLLESDLDTDPELISAINNSVIHDVRPDEDGNQTVFTAAPMFEDGQLLGYVRLASPATIPQSEIRQRWLILGTGFGVFALLGLLVSLWLSSTLTRPLSSLRDAALRMAQGDLSQRIAQPRSDETGEVAAAFNHMATQVQTMVEEQRAFVSNVSHELRTPLTTLRLRTELLQSGTVDETTAQQYIAEIDSEVNRLGGLIDDLILLSRIDAARLTTGNEKVDPARLLAALIREATPLAETRKLSLFLEESTNIPPVQTNMNHIRVVFRNLLENAIKYTPDGGNIRWRLIQDGSFLKAQLCDNGQGIAAEDLPQVNQRFYRTDKARSRRIEGVGLGLALVQSIVNIYSGKFHIESPGPGLGTTVTIWWPFEQKQPESS